jgi:hypothetical protein
MRLQRITNMELHRKPTGHDEPLQMWVSQKWRRGALAGITMIINFVDEALEPQYNAGKPRPNL